MFARVNNNILIEMAESLLQNQCEHGISFGYKLITI